MIQSIKIPVNVIEKNKELCFDYEDDTITIYLNGRYICSFDYENNFKQVIEKMIEQW